MRFGRTLPPAASPISKFDILKGLKGMIRGRVEVDELINDLKDYFNVRHCFLLSSGKAALFSILKALKEIYPDRNEVIIPAFTCYSVPSAIVRAGLKVRLCDVNPKTLDYNFTELKKITITKNKFLAIVCPHLFGLPADIANVRLIIADPKIAVIEDAAQAMGGVFNNHQLGTFGDIGFFSLGRGKVFSTVAGGIIITNSKRIAEIIQKHMQSNVAKSIPDNAKLMVYALALSILTNPSLFWLPKMIPGLKLGETIYDPHFPLRQFSPFQAGLARNWRKRMILMQHQRKQNVCYWREVLQRFQWLHPIPNANKSNAETFPLLRFPVLVQNSSLRNALLKVSETQGLGIMITYPKSINKIEGFEYDNKSELFPGAQECVDRLVTFPVHGFLSSNDRQRITKSLEMLHKNLSLLPDCYYYNHYKCD